MRTSVVDALRAGRVICCAKAPSVGWEAWPQNIDHLASLTFDARKPSGQLVSVPDSRDAMHGAAGYKHATGLHTTAVRVHIYDANLYEQSKTCRSPIWDESRSKRASSSMRSCALFGARSAY